MAIYDTTRWELRHQIARLFFDDLITGTVASAASGNFVCDETDWEKADDYFNDWIEVFDYNGTGVGTSGNPTDWDNTTHTLTFLPAATLTNGDLVELHRRFTVNAYNDAINLAIESMAKEALVNKVDETVVLDNLLSNSMFETDATLTGWTDSTNAPTTSERSTTFVMEGDYSAKMVSDGTNANWIYQSVTDYARYLGKSYLLKCLVHTTTADRVRLALYDGTDRTYSEYHAGEEVEELQVSGTLDEEATEFTVELRVESGSAVTVYFDACWLASGHIYEYDLPTNFLYVNKVEMEKAKRDEYEEIHQNYWKIVPESTQLLVFKDWTPTMGRKIRISGMASPATLSADTTECPVNPEWLAWQAAAYLHVGRIRGTDQDAEDHRRQFERCQTTADRLRPKARTRLPQGSRAVVEM